MGNNFPHPGKDRRPARQVPHGSGEGGTAMSTTAAPVRSRAFGRPVPFDAGPGARARIGLVALSGDATVEPDFRRLGLGPDVELYVSRVAFGTVTIEGLREVAEHLTAATALILPGQRLDAIAYGCTSGTIVVGEEAIGQRIAAARPGLPWTTPITGAVAGFRKLGVRRVAVLTPYVDEVNLPVIRHLEKAGIGVVDMVSFGLLTEADMVRVPQETIIEAAGMLDLARADAIFVSCTALRALGVLEKLEGMLGKPVLASNHAMYWHALRLAGYADPVAGFGRLYRV